MASPAKTITTNIQKVTGISINPSSTQTKNIGETFKITATVSPSDANNKSLNWSSSNSGIATVDNSGNVRCVSAGTTTITATAADGSGKSASLSLTVRDPLTSLTLDKPQTTLLYGGATTTVTASTTPSDYDANNLTWTIGDTSLATISGNGKTRTITSNNTKKTGETTLTVSGGGKTATMKVSIVNFTTTTYSYTGSIKSVTIPAGTYKIECWGAQGSNNYTGNSIGGKGGYSAGNFTFLEQTVLQILVVQQGSKGNDSGNWEAGGGGGGSFVAKGSSYNVAEPLIIAGGGGGAGGSDGNQANGLPGGKIVSPLGSASTGGVSGDNGGGGGAGFSTNGKVGDYNNARIYGTAFTNGGTRSSTASNSYSAYGGFGGGGAGGGNPGGGGGGYCGGNKGKNGDSKYLSGQTGGYGGTSYNLGTAPINYSGIQTFSSPNGNSETGHSGNGFIRITPVN